MSNDSLSAIVKSVVCLVCLLMASAVKVQAEDDVVMKFDFSNVSGKDVIDGTSGITAKMCGSAKVEKVGTYTVLNLGASNGYLDLTAAAGEKIAALGSFSISCYYYVPESTDITGNGNFLWAFSTNTACSSNAGVYHAYRVNAQRIATTPGGYSKEVGFDLGKASDKERWMHVCYTQIANNGKLYIDGKLAGSSASMPAMKSTFAESPKYCWLGRPPFSGDAYLVNAKLYDFCVYGKVLSLSAIRSMAAVTEDLEYQYQYGVAGDFTKLRSAVESAEAYLQTATQSGKYPQAALADYADVVTYSRLLLDQGIISQTFIDQQVKALTAAKTVLSAASGFTFSFDGNTTAYSPERGFRHPGGLHTREDFERIKQQLADRNSKVTEAYNVLKNAAYAQSTAATYPTEVIVRGGGNGENYINAARGATIAYQNALRWQIEGNTDCARHAVDVLMSWARTTKSIGGDSNYALAAGLYGYQFAQAAELVRDYDGWAPADFQTFQRWMLDVWYPSAIGFLRGRNGTWENTGKWWQAPGHYWSNWGLCNALCVISIGVLCDDVNIYNQGMSFIKYDQVGTFKDPRTDSPILNDGLTEFWGNLIVTTAPWEKETGAYGRVGQMNESGRDIGHSAMALGLAVDIAHQGWNQGDDLFSYMDYRLAAGIEYVAAQTQSIEGLPWTDYVYGSSGYYYTDSRCWTMTGPALGAQMRPYWATVIGHYEGIKGVRMPFSEMAYKQMGIDAGGQGSTSGGYDHLGYSVLLNTRDGLANTEQIPVELQARMIVNGNTILHNELGMLANTFATTPLASRGVKPGTAITLSPTLPEGVEDTGKWRWDTGETTRELTITANDSHIYRVHYVNSFGVESEQCYSIAVLGDGQPTTLTPTIEVGGKVTAGTEITVDYGTTITLNLQPVGGWGEWEWENGSKTSTITLNTLTRSRDITGCFINQAGRRNYASFHISVNPYVPDPAGINTIEVQPKTDAAFIYDLSGRPVRQMKPGTIYVKNGKKIMTK